MALNFDFISAMHICHKKSCNCNIFKKVCRRRLEDVTDYSFFFKLLQRLITQCMYVQTILPVIFRTQWDNSNLVRHCILETKCGILFGFTKFFRTLFSAHASRQKKCNIISHEFFFRKSPNISDDFAKLCRTALVVALPKRKLGILKTFLKP